MTLLYKTHFICKSLKGLILQKCLKVVYDSYIFQEREIPKVTSKKNTNIESKYGKIVGIDLSRSHCHIVHENCFFKIGIEITKA